LPTTYDEFEKWVDEFSSGLLFNFAEVYEEEFGHGEESAV
jgi:hypothetical protein